MRRIPSFAAPPCGRGPESGGFRPFAPLFGHDRRVEGHASRRGISRCVTLQIEVDGSASLTVGRSAERRRRSRQFARRNDGPRRPCAGLQRPRVLFVERGWWFVRCSAGPGVRPHRGRDAAEGGSLLWEADLFTPACGRMVGHLAKAHADVTGTLRSGQRGRGGVPCARPVPHSSRPCRSPSACVDAPSPLALLTSSSPP